MTARQIWTISFRLSAFMLAAALLFGAIYMGCSFCFILPMHVFSESYSKYVPLVMAVLFFGAVFVYAVRRILIMGPGYTKPSYAQAIPEGTRELKDCLKPVLVIDLVLGVVTLLVLHA